MVWNFIAQLAIGLVLSAVAYALSPRPKTETPRPAGLDDLSVPTAEEGRPIPVVFGTVLISGPNVVWAGDLRVDPIRKKGGKK
jgi:predicted phage tail protein